jgi:hypothetical protein
MAYLPFLSAADCPSMPRALSCCSSSATRFERVVIGGRSERRRGVARVETVGAPPVDADGFRFVDRADHEAELDGEELDVRERDFDVSRDDEALVENLVEDVDEALRLALLDCHLRREQ